VKRALWDRRYAMLGSPALRSTPQSLAFVLVVLVSLFPFWQPLNMLVRLSLQNERYTHILLVPFISLCVFCLECKETLPNARYAPKLGIPLLALGMILFWILNAHPSPTETGSLFLLMPSIILVWVAAFLLCYGPQVLRAAAFPVCFLLLMAPIPVGLLNQVTLGLQKSSAEVTYLLFKVSGMPVFRQGFRFSLPGVEIEIAEQCSGIRSGLAILITSILAGHAFLKPWWSKGMLVLFAIPLAIFKNAVRIVTISTLGVYVNRAFLYGNLHRRGGLVFALLAVLMLVPAIVVLQKAERRDGLGRA